MFSDELWRDGARMFRDSNSSETETRARSQGTHDVAQPVLLTNNIGFRGFKAMVFVATASHTVHVIDYAAQTSRGITTFKRVEQDGKPAFQPGWISPSIRSRLPPLII
jgi:hypothetical protein